MKYLHLFIATLFFVGCLAPTNPPSTPPPPVTTTVQQDTSLLKGFQGSIYLSPTYVKVINEDPEQFVSDTSQVGVSDSLLVVISSSINAKLFVKNITNGPTPTEKMYFADFSQTNLKDTSIYDAVLYVNGPRSTIQFHYEDYAFFFYDIQK